MSRSRLSLIGADDLADKLNLFSAEERRAIAARCSRLAVEHACLRDPVIEIALSKLESGETLDQLFRARLKKTVQDLDDNYLIKNERFHGRRSLDAGDRDQLFRQARAASAVQFCFETDSAHGAAEAIYEASQVVDLAELRRLFEARETGA
jgi:hypothetical protein